MDSRAVLTGGVPTGILAIIIGRLSSLPNILLLGFLAGVITGYLTKNWGNEMKDGAAASVLACGIAFLGIGILATSGQQFGAVYTYLFVSIPFYAVEGLIGATVAVRFFGSAVSRPS